MQYSAILLTVGISMSLLACGGGSAPSTQTTTTPKYLSLVTTSNGVSTFTGKRANYTITKTSTGYTVKDNVGVDGVTNLTAPSRLIFTDVAVAFDLTGMAGKAYRVYQAAFNRTPDQGGLGFWVSSMDQGMSLSSVAAGFMGSDEFKAKYGANPSNADFVAALYTNVLRRPLDQGGYDFWVNNLNNKAITAAEVLASFSESDENKAQVATAIADGISYSPYLPPLSPLTLDTFAACPDSAHSTQALFYKCMTGTIAGQTTFDKAPCTLTITGNGTITVAANGKSIGFNPLGRASYSKSTISNKSDTFLLQVIANGFDVNVANAINMATIRVTSPKFAASGIGESGIQVDATGGSSTNAGTLSCKFAL